MGRDAEMEETVTQRLVDLLREEDADFELLTHEPVHTSEEAARARGTALEQGAKALVCRADDRIVLIVVQAHRRMDSRAFKRAYGVKNLQMISAEELFSLTGLAPGAVPPFGILFGFPTYVDTALLELPRIAFNAGSRDRSIILATADYRRIAPYTSGTFAAEVPPPSPPAGN
jgi:Ala-tRNA(Pro) deacylase